MENRGIRMLKVFLVEDESVIREGFRDKIPWGQYGFELVGEAGDGEMALPMIRKLKPDLLITDIKMPFMDGLSLSEIVKEELPKARIIIISGYDDFEYARQAIKIGIDQYLLKPVTRLALRGVLMELKEKIEQETENRDYQDQYREEVREFEQFPLRRFFERLLDGRLSAKEIYEEEAALSLDLSAACYNLLLFTVYGRKKADAAKGEQCQEELFHFFLRHPQYTLFRLNVSSYGVLIRGEASHMEMLREQAFRCFEEVCGHTENRILWYAAVGTPVERLSLLPECYREANHSFAYRFILPDQHILSRETLGTQSGEDEEATMKSVDFMQMDPDIIKDFLARGEEKEIHDFVESYLIRIRRPLQSTMFRSYVVLNIRFAVVSFLESIGAGKEAYQEQIEKAVQSVRDEAGELFPYFAGILKTAMEIRNEINQYQGGKQLKKALEYIDEHYGNEELSLGQVAEVVGMSSNYFSAIFSQNMEKTFVEYVTEKRIEKAKKLLRQTDHASGEIAKMVGYKDAHYFGFVFKKLQGSSPREYRNENR